MNAFKGFVDDEWIKSIRRDHSDYVFIYILFLYCYQKYNSPQQQNNKTHRQAAVGRYYLLGVLQQ